MRTGCWSLFLLAIAVVPGTAQAVDLDGTWYGTTLPLMLQLHQRADGTVLGYLPGGKTYVAGQVVGGSFLFSVDAGDPGRDELIVASAAVSGDTMTLTAPGGPFVLTRTPDVYDEQRYLLLPLGGSGEPDTEFAVELSIAHRAGTLAVGSYEPLNRCGAFGCSGDVTGFAEVPATDGLHFDLDWGGACPGSASVDVDWDAGQSGYLGSYSLTDCSGPQAGSVMLAVSIGTRTDHLAEVFASLGRLADDMENELSFADPHPSIDAAYLHHGLDDGGLRSALDGQSAAWRAIEVEQSRFDAVHTVQHPRMHPFLMTDFVAPFHEQRTGAPLGEGQRTAFRDSDAGILDGELKVVGERAGEWILFGNQDPDPAGISLPFDVDDIEYAFFGAWPFGAHGGGHPEGHPGIDFELRGATVLVAVRSGTITDIRVNDLTPDQVNVDLQSGGMSIKYQHVDATLAPGIVVGAQVVAGQPIGSPGEFCCDPTLCCNAVGCAPGGEATCCDDNYPGLGDCDPQTNPDYHHLIHFGVNLDVDAACPWEAMNATARQELETLFLDARYSEQLTEPFLCNEPDRNDDAMPYVTRWERTTAVDPANPATIVFSRPDTYEKPDYQFLDASETTVSSGIACADDPANPTEIRFIENGSDCFQAQPGTFERTGQFELPGEVVDARLRLDLEGGGFDEYRPLIVDQNVDCVPAPGMISDLRLNRAAGGLQLTFDWTDTATADDYILFEASAPDARFDMVSGIAASGAGGMALPTPGAVRFYKVAARNASCGVAR